MVKGDNPLISPTHFGWQTPSFNCISASLKPAELGCLPESLNYSGIHTFCGNISMQGFTVPNPPSARMQQSNGVLPKCRPSLPTLVLPTSPCLKENLSTFSFALSGETAPNAIPGCQRRFLVFDQSGSEARSIYSAVGPTVWKPTALATKPVHGNCWGQTEDAGTMDHLSPTTLKLHEVSGENQLSGEESKMHEDSEEINALLYSDDDDDEDDDDGDDDEDDEVTSTGHSPILFSEGYGMQEQVAAIAEEVCSSAIPNKRQKLLDGGYGKSSTLGCAVEVEGPHWYDNDVQSSYATGQSQEENMVSILGNKQLTKDKIRATLKILESIIPCAKDKDPLLLLDEAIFYLKSLKLKAKQ